MNDEIWISVVIVSYNVKHILEQCLWSVRAALEGINAEVIVVDNNSSDGTVAYLKPIFTDVLFIANTDNKGFASANNQAIRLSRGKYVLLLNPDTVIGESSLRSLCFIMDERPKIGGIGVKMINGKGEFLPESKRSFPTPWVSFCKISGLSKLFPLSPKYASYSLLYLNADKEHNVEVLSGAFMLLRHEALDKVGLLDESFFMYGEDIDMSYRIVLGGWENLYVPERILHYKGESTRENSSRYIHAFYGAMRIFYRKYFPDSSLFMKSSITLAIRLREAIAIIASPFHKRNAKVHHRRLLIFCFEEHFAAARKLCTDKMPHLEHVNHWYLNDARILDSMNRWNKMNDFTDYAFCYPDARFEQMMLFMDKYPDKKVSYHIINLKNNRVISAGI